MSIRSIFPGKYTIINQAITNEVIEEVEESKALFEVVNNWKILNTSSSTFHSIDIIIYLY